MAKGIANGFRLQYTGPRLRSFSNNLVSTKEFPKETMEKINKEISMGRICGPFKNPPMSNLIVSPIGILRKSDGGWRLITHPSYPPGRSINNYIDPDLCSVNYTSFDSVIDKIATLGKQVESAKIDKKSAFRLLRVNPADFTLMGI